MELSTPSAASRLPHHKRRLEAICRAAMDDPQILAMFIGGSFASGEADEYSDLDLQLIVEDGAIDRLVPKLRPLADQAGRVVAAFSAEHVGLPNMLIVLYEDLVHVDLQPVQFSDVGSRNAGLSTHVLWERDPSISSVLGAKHEADPAGELAWFEDRIWTWSWYVQTKILRGELYEALSSLQYLRDNVLFRLLAMHRDELPSAARRAESRVGPWEERFAATVATLDQHSTMEALKSSIELYVDLVGPLQGKYGVRPADEARAVSLSALADGMDWSSDGSERLAE